MIQHPMEQQAMPAALDAAALQRLRAWTGRSEEVHDDITAAPLRGWSATLDRTDAPPRPGDAVPPLGHWLYFLPQAPQGELGADGHPRRGGFLPPVPLPRRMWAGGRLAWQADTPLRVGDAARRVSRIESVSHKSGRSGEMVFVLVKHDVHNARGLALTEEHDIVYRGAPLPGATPPAPQAAEQQAPWRREIVPDPVLLFRYSALTFNGHRIHYDRRYVTEVEGYPGLVVHGPLIATLLVDLARRHAPGRFVRRFEFRAVRPTFDLHPFFVNGQPLADGRGVRLWAHDHEGWLTVQGALEFE
ncbi:MaoC family dehydratase N-terminal domain-containing protein [Ottowia pentelensis]|uniref:MaoC family dehydratase N-terminal domain-containing protein n=1 Tax=Ottowia pentelensis TaxID=511108 RepID=A0ABV6PRF2_9BURK